MRLFTKLSRSLRELSGVEEHLGTPVVKAVPTAKNEEAVTRIF